MRLHHLFLRENHSWLRWLQALWLLVLCLSLWQSALAQTSPSVPKTASNLAKQKAFAKQVLTKQDSAVMRATHIKISWCQIGRRVIVNASFSPNVCNNPQSVPLLACKIGDAPEEITPLEERFSYKNRSLGYNNWSHNFRFGYIKAKTKSVIVRALWLRDADTITLRSDTLLPKFSILRPNRIYQSTVEQSRERQYAVLPNVNANNNTVTHASVRFTLQNIAPPYSVYVPLDVRTPASGKNQDFTAYPEVLYATTGNMDLVGTPPYIDFAVSSLAVYAGNMIDTSIVWKSSPATL